MVYLKLLSYKDVVDLLVYSSNISYNNNNKNNTAEYNKRRYARCYRHERCKVETWVKIHFIINEAYSKMV